MVTCAVWRRAVPRASLPGSADLAQPGAGARLLPPCPLSRHAPPQPVPARGRGAGRAKLRGVWGSWRGVACALRRGRHARARVAVGEAGVEGRWRLGSTLKGCTARLCAPRRRTHAEQLSLLPRRKPPTLGVQGLIPWPRWNPLLLPGQLVAGHGPAHGRRLELQPSSR